MSTPSDSLVFSRSRVLIFLVIVATILHADCYNRINEQVPRTRPRRQSSSCHQDEFECDDGSCIPSYRSCDWYLDCADRSDEGINCQYNGFECKSGNNMVSVEWMCDGFNDCEDGSDEEEEYCRDQANEVSKICPRISCDNNKRCVQEKELCDGVQDCTDGLDESDELCRAGKGKCFSCDGGLKCLEWDWVCDEIADCSDIADELSGWCGTVFQRCWKGSYLCGHTHFCVPQRWRCDSHDDCGDDTDEEDCQTDIAWTGSFGWSSWGDWSECHPSCGPGSRSRSRICESPAESCLGESQKDEECQQAECHEEEVIGCGIKQHIHFRDDGALAERVVGGQPTDSGEWPWQAQLFYQTRGAWRPVCGGTLIDPQVVLTAAHCFMGSIEDLKSSDDARMAPSRWQVHLGKHSIDFVPETGSQHRLVREIIVHKKFNQNGGVGGDIALLLLDEPVHQETGQINWACLDEGMKLNAKTECYISGWGVTEMGGKSPQVLHEAKMPLIPRRICNYKKSYNGKIERTMLCAGHMEGGIDACQGDSGGPLSCLGPDDQWYVVGVTSWGHGCAIANKPGVYTRVSSYLEWIHEMLHHHLHH